MKNHPSLLSARCRFIDKLHNHQCHGSSNFRCRLLDVQRKKKNTHTASCSRRFRDMAIPGGGSSHYGVQRNLCMHACICRGCRGWASLSLSLSTRSPKGLLPFWTRRLRLFPFLFLSTQRAQIFKICTAFVYKGINHLKPRFFFPLTLGTAARQWDCRGPHCWPWSKI